MKNKPHLILSKTKSGHRAECPHCGFHVLDKSRRKAIKFVVKDGQCRKCRGFITRKWLFFY